MAIVHLRTVGGKPGTGQVRVGSNYPARWVPANSLVGSTANDFVGNNSVFPLSNGNYVVVSPIWDNGSAVDAGAVDADAVDAGAVELGAVEGCSLMSAS